MAYNLYQVPMAKGWVERIEKETQAAEKFWAQQAQQEAQAAGQRKHHHHHHHAPGSIAGQSLASAAPSGYTSKTAFLKDKLETLEKELAKEREYRHKVEEELATLRTVSKPGTPR